MLFKRHWLSEAARRNTFHRCVAACAQSLLTDSHEGCQTFWTRDGPFRTHGFHPWWYVSDPWVTLPPPWWYVSDPWLPAHGGTFRTHGVRFHPWLSGKNSQNFHSCVPPGAPQGGAMCAFPRPCFAESTLGGTICAFPPARCNAYCPALMHLRRGGTMCVFPPARGNA